MKIAFVFGVVAAVVLHAAVLLFGGILFAHGEESQATLQEVELLDDVAADAEDEKKDAEPEKPDDAEEMDAEPEEAPDASEIIESLERSPLDAAPALDSSSLGAIEAALNGEGGGDGGFGESLSFASGGRIGGTGTAKALESALDDALSMAEIDQKPQAVFKQSPAYPSELRGKKVEGVVTLIFVVDASGRVADPRVEKSSHPAFDKPALAALKQWKFEPGVKGGRRVACKMRLPIRFPAG